MLKASIIIPLLLLFGCASSLVEYQVATGERENQNLSTNSDKLIVNPDKLAVKSKGLEKFYFKEAFQPVAPEWLNGRGGDIFVKIQPTDIWVVTHVYDNYYIIQSDSFNGRQCRKRLFGDFVNIFNRCSRHNDYGLWISKKKYQIIGWANLPGPRRVLHNRTVELIMPNYYKANKEAKVNWPKISVEDKKD
jgi:hypothetical protein